MATGIREWLLRSSEEYEVQLKVIQNITLSIYHRRYEGGNHKNVWL